MNWRKKYQKKKSKPRSENIVFHDSSSARLRLSPEQWQDYRIGTSAPISTGMAQSQDGTIMHNPGLGYISVTEMTNPESIRFVGGGSMEVPMRPITISGTFELTPEGYNRIKDLFENT